MFSSYSLFAAFSTSDAVCVTPALVSAAAELPLFSFASSIAEETFLVTDSLSMEVSLVEGLSELVREGREGILSGGKRATSQGVVAEKVASVCRT